MRTILSHKRTISLIALIIHVVGMGYVKAQSPNLTVVRPDYGNNSMQVRWAPAAYPNITEYRIRVKSGAGAFGPWISVGTSTSYTDSPITPGVLYTYQVKVKSVATWVDSSNVLSNKLEKIWPVADGSNFNATNRNVLNGFNQSIQASGGGGTLLNYLHEGVDMNGDVNFANDYVKSPVGGIILNAGGAGTGIHINIEFLVNGVPQYVQCNHLTNLSPTLVANHSIKPGDTIGQILNSFGSIQSSHTHFHYWTSNANFFGTSLDPFSFFSNNAERDPHNNTPNISDSNGDGEVLRFKKKLSGSAYFQANKPIYCGTDVVVECFDIKSSGGFKTAPKRIGYYVEKQEDANWVNAIKSSAAPYVLIDNANGYFNSNNITSDQNINNSLHDRNASLKAITPAGYGWSQWYTYVVTNTNGTNGTAGNLDTNQCWASDARNSVASDNGYVNNYDKARMNEEAKFEDGKYRVSVNASDWVNAAPEYRSEVTVDNFLPFVKKVTMNSGTDVYEASWVWNSGTMNFSPNSKTDEVKCNKDLVIKITTSEPMKELSLSIAKLGFSNTNAAAEPNTKQKEWKFTVPANLLSSAHTGDKLVLSIKGKDLADNEIWGFTSRSAIAEAGIPKRKEDGNWTVTPALVEDTLHSFKINKPNFKVSATEASCEPNGVGTATVNLIKATEPVTYKWSNGQTTSTANNLAPGAYSVLVTDANGCDSTGNTVVTKKNCPKPPDPFTIPVVNSGDPNDITGPAGFGDPKWVSVNDELPYTIRFENDPKIATSAVNKVIVTHPIDKNANMFSFQLGVITFRGITVDVPKNSSHYYKRLNLKDSMGVLIDITAGLDVTKNQAFWIFQAFDPSTGLPNINPDLGFLLINDSIHHMGEGAVSFSIQPKFSANTGDSIKAYADIIFDVNETIRTNEAFNTIDAHPPKSKIKSITKIDEENIQIALSGADDKNGCGIADFQLMIAVNNQAYQALADASTDSVLNMKIQNGSTYSLMALSKDYVKNAEELKDTPDTTFSVEPDNFFKFPNAQTKTCAGGSLSINWRNLNNILKINLKISADSGKTYTGIAQNLSVTDTSYTYEIPLNFPANKYCILKAVNSLDTSTIARSNYFLVKNKIKVDAGPDNFFCEGDSIKVGGNPTAADGAGPYQYTWSPSVSLYENNNSNPFALKNGTYTVTVKDALGCSNSDTLVLKMLEKPLVYLYGLDTSYYTSSAPVSLTGSPDNGVYAGNGITINLFNPSIAGIGKHTISYTYTSSNGCKNTASKTTTVIQTPFSTINGLLTYDNSVHSPLGNSTMLLNNNGGGTDSCSTASDGAYLLNNVVIGDYTLSAKTTIPWGGVNATDALLVKKYAIGAIQLSDLRILAADVNLSHTINATDALNISKRTIGLSNSFAAGDWVFERDTLHVNNHNIQDDLKGLCVGDVNGSYIPALSSKTLNMALLSDGTTLGAPTVNFYIPVKTKTAFQAGAITLGLSYPNTVFSIEGISSKANGLIYNTDNNGNVKIAWSDPIPLNFSVGDTVLTLMCHGISKLSGSYNLSLIGGSEFADKDANVINGVTLSAPTIEYGTTTNIDALNPDVYALLQNKPNPFNRYTEIEYQLPEDGNVSLKVYNIFGVIVAELINSDQLKGKHSIKFDCTNLSSGIYSYQLNVIGRNTIFSQTKSMSVTK